MSDAIEAARRIQAAAADPARSVLLAAAAGAGKTTVLVDRYLRLCLEGLDPRAILAITFTRKATIEIQGRLQGMARQLAGRDEQARVAELARILAARPGPEAAARAAWFHEILLEDPAGLGIETMHAFCQRLLGRFAAEAGLDPRFSVLEEQAELAYRTEALDRLEADLAREPAAASRYAALADTAAAARARLAGLFDHRVHLQRWIDRVAPPPPTVAGALGRRLRSSHAALAADLRRGLLAGTPLAGQAEPRPSHLAADLAAALAVFLQDGLEGLAACDRDAGITPGLQGQLDAWRAAAAGARALIVADPDAVPAAATILRTSLLTGDGDLFSPRGRKASGPARREAFAAAAAPLFAVLQQADLLDLLADNEGLLDLGLRALDHHEACKRRDRVVDFQDLEYLALRLLTDPGGRAHVHERLDARLAHLLLDEFQDTNRNQWDLLAPLFEEALAGGEPPRTVLVVGDVKQSIYGFRGAEPGVFARAAERIRRQAGDEALMVLPTNFRSLPAIVGAVGALCQQPPIATHLGEQAAGAVQQVARREAPGEVVCVRPFVRQDDRSGHELAAEALAGLIVRLLAEGRRPAGAAAAAPGPLRHDDILVLVRAKTHLAVYEAALRRAGIPFTPAGRGLLARGREVQDVLALLRWLTYPADDVAGAVVLRSPLCRLPEQQVQDLLAARNARPSGRRRRSLREVLRERRDDPEIGPLVERLGGWFAAAGRQPLHDLLRRLYREGDALARFEIAHGEQARFNLLRLCDLALAAEERGGSLRDFVDELDRAALIGGEEEGTLPAEAGSGRVRLMTVHGAKGLQAPVVILADAATPLRDSTEQLLLDDWPADGPWVHGVKRRHWRGPGAGDGRCLPGALSDRRAQALARLLAEEAHVLYVALTRAGDRLYVLGGLNDKQGADRTARSFLGWIEAADAAAAGSGVLWKEPHELLDEASRAGPSPSVGRDAALAARAADVAARHAVWTPPPMTPRYQLGQPSRLEDDRRDAAGDPGGAEDAVDPGAPQALRQAAGRRDNPATRRGSRIHAWLERACLLGRWPSPPAAADLLPQWEEARAVWQDPDLAWIFAPDPAVVRALSEAPLLHRLADDQGERRRYGVIDRLLIGPDRVDIVDYKTNRIDAAQVDEAVAHYRPQLLAYRDALAAIHPDRRLRCWLLWTAPAMAGRRLTEVR